MASGGVVLAERLMASSMAELPAALRHAMEDHEANGCRYAPGAFDRIMAGAPLCHCPLELLEYFDGALEAEEVYCPERGIGVAKAA